MALFGRKRDITGMNGTERSGAEDNGMGENRTNGNRIEGNRAEENRMEGNRMQGNGMEEGQREEGRNEKRMGGHGRERGNGEGRKRRGWGFHGSTPEAQTLSDVIRGMQHCVNAAAEVAEEHYLRQLEKYFDDDGNPILFTYRDNGGRQISVPLFTLMSHNELLMDEITIKMSLPIKNSDQTTMPIDNNAIDDFSVTRSVFYLDSLGTAPKGKHGDMEIEMKFKSGRCPEEVSRVVDDLMNCGTEKVKLSEEK